MNGIITDGTIIIDYTNLVLVGNNLEIRNIKIKFLKEGRYIMTIPSDRLNYHTARGQYDSDIVIYFQYSLNPIDIRINANYDLLDSSDYTYNSTSNNEQINNEITTVEGNVDIDVYLSKFSADFHNYCEVFPNYNTDFITLDNVDILSLSPLTNASSILYFDDHLFQI